MRALELSSFEGPAALREVDLPDPRPGPFEVLIRVAAVGLNRADLLQSRGLYPAPLGFPAKIPGLEYSGEVIEAGAHVTRHRPGDRVMGIVGGGAFAQLLCVHEREAIVVPRDASFEEAAAIPEAFFTAYDALVLQGGLRSGEHVLIHAAASGVGTAAVQLASALGATAIGTGRSEEKLHRLAELGLAFPILVGRPPSFSQAVKKASSGRGVDLVLDLVGGAYLPETIASCASQARVLLVGLLAGTKAELDLSALLSKRLRLIGTTLRGRPLEEKIQLAQLFERHVLPLFENGELEPVVDAVLSMDQAAAGLERLANNATFGKIVLTWEKQP